MSTATLEPRVRRTAQLSQRRLRLEILAVHAGSQAHRHSVPGLHYVFLRHRQFVRRSDARFSWCEPQGALVQPETYNKLFTLHGIIMIFFFLIPSIPAVLGNFLVPLMVGRARSGISETEFT